MKKIFNFTNKCLFVLATASQLLFFFNAKAQFGGGGGNDQFTSGSGMTQNEIDLNVSRSQIGGGKCYYTVIKDPVLGLGFSLVGDCTNGCKLTLENNGNLVVTNQANQILWESNTAGQGIVKATFIEDGNFALLTSNNSVKWSSQTPRSGANLLVIAGEDGGIKLLKNIDKSVVWLAIKQGPVLIDP